MLNVELRVVEGKQQGKTIPLTVRQFLIGREQDCHLRPNTDLVSRHHCVFTVDDYTVRLRDLGSTNGTYVNGERIQGQVVLKPGDEVSVGKLKFKVVVSQPAAVGAATSEKAPAVHLEPPSVPEIPIEAQPATPVPQMETAINISDTIEVPAPASPSGDTAIIPAAAAGAEQPVAQLQPGYAMPPGYVMPGYPGYPPAGYPVAPGYPPGYGAPVAYGQPAFVPPGYPAPGYPPAAGYGMPPMYPPPEQAPAKAKTFDIPDVVLPDPSTTGATAPPAPAPAPAAPVAATGSPEGTPPAPPPADAKKPSEAAADIIRMHRLRRPNT